MPRPSSFSTTRRMVMQGTMLGILLGTIGTAALMGRSRQRVLAVTLDATPVPVGELTVRLPHGWHVQPRPVQDKPRSEVAAIEPATRGGQRTIRINQSPVVGDDGPLELIERHLAKRLGVIEVAQPFEFLGAPGVLVQFTALTELPDPLAPQVQEPQWYAATILPGAADGQGSLGVIVELLNGWKGPSGDRVLRQVAAGLERRDPASTQPSNATGSERGEQGGD